MQPRPHRPERYSTTQASTQVWMTSPVRRKCSPCIDAAGRFGYFSFGVEHPVEMLFGAGGAYGFDVFVSDEDHQIHRIGIETLRSAFGELR